MTNAYIISTSKSLIHRGVDSANLYFASELFSCFLPFRSKVFAYKSVVMLVIEKYGKGLEVIARAGNIQ